MGLEWLAASDRDRVFVTLGKGPWRQAAEAPTVGVALEILRDDEWSWWDGQERLARQLFAFREQHGSIRMVHDAGGDDFELRQEYRELWSCYDDVGT